MSKRDANKPLWDAYAKSRSIADRNALVERYMWLAHKHAYHLTCRSGVALCLTVPPS